jgi:hypothetical protein
MLIAGFAGFLALERVGWRRAWAIFQPLSGLLLFLALCLPWWWLLRQALGAEALAGSQLAGSLLRPNWTQIFDPYYLYRGPQLALPWLVLFAVLAVVAVRGWGEDPRLRLLAILVLVPALLLSLGPQRRWYYMLPTLMPMCLLLAAAWQRVCSEPGRWQGLRRWLGGALPAQWAVVLVVVAGSAVWADPAAFPDLRQSLLWALPILLALGFGYRRFRPGGGEPLAAAMVSTAMFLVVAGSVYAGGAGLLDGKKRETLTLAEVIAAETSPSVPLATLGTANEPFVYYTGRRVLGFSDGSGLRAWWNEKGRAKGVGLILILRRSALPQLPPEFVVGRLYSGAEGRGDPLIVLELGSAVDTERP